MSRIITASTAKATKPNMNDLKNIATFFRMFQ
jgi:hypothetical protein